MAKALFLKIYKENPNDKQIARIAEILRDGGVIIYPTDTVYGFGCDINNAKAVERIAQLKGVDLKKTNFSFICHDLSHLSDYAAQVDNHFFKLIKHNSPGPFTFVLAASKKVPKLFKSKKKTVGIRIPDCIITRELIKTLGNPILSSSVYDDDEYLEYSTDPELIYEKYKDLVDCVIDGGTGDITPSTIVDLSNNEVNILRQGKGELID